MKRMVQIRNKTNSPVQFGERVIPVLGVLHMPYAEYSSTIRDYEIQGWGLEVDVRQVDFKSVSVKDFGAKGDGVADDTYQMQAAIDYVVGNGGGVVNVPIGVYVVSNLSIAGNVVLVGESKVDSIIKSTVTGKSALTFVGGECGAKTLRLVV